MGVDLRAKFVGCMVGSALGDAIGEMAFRFPERDRLRRAVDGADTLRYTDDTAMALGLAEALVQKGRVDQQWLGDIFRRNFHREPWRGYASGPPTLFSTVSRTGVSYLEAARGLFGGQGSLGNGAAMRIGPLGLYFHRSDHLYEEACASAEVTHAHPVGKDGSAVQALAVARAVTLDPELPLTPEGLARVLEGFARTQEVRQKMALVGSLIREDVRPAAAASVLGRGVAVHESMPFAIYSFLRHPHSFEECLFCAVLNGGDRDTLGAMACAISGAYLGAGAIPQGWARKLENRSAIERLAEELLRATNLHRG